MKKILLFLIITFYLSGCASYNLDKKLGYIGFNNNELWAIQFNDCTEHSLSGAEKYLWFDRVLLTVSCYRFKNTDASRLRRHQIEIYESPSVNSKSKIINKFQEMHISETGWGTFPWVYERFGENWFKVKEGWLILQASDRNFVQYYPGRERTVWRA